MMPLLLLLVMMIMTMVETTWVRKTCLIDALEYKQKKKIQNNKHTLSTLNIQRGRIAGRARAGFRLSNVDGKRISLSHSLLPHAFFDLPVMPNFVSSSLSRAALQN